jgi:hypothetical protein
MLQDDWKISHSNKSLTSYLQILSSEIGWIHTASGQKCGEKRTSPIELMRQFGGEPINQHY